MIAVLLNNDLRTSFEYNEALECAKQFNKVFVLLEPGISTIPPLPSNVIADVKTLNIQKSWKRFLIFNLPSILGVWLYEPKRGENKRSLKQGLHVLSYAKLRANAIKTFLRLNQLNSENTIISSFWFYDVTVLGWLRKIGWNGPLVSRAHRGDIYEDWGSINVKTLFRKFELSNVDKVFSVSIAGTDYLKNRYPSHSDKISTLHLGSPDFGFSKQKKTTELNILTCAIANNKKRLFLLAELLLNADFDVCWTHVGPIPENDPTTQRLKKALDNLASNKYVTYIHKGELSQGQIYAFYKENYFDLFVSVSQTEGIPVSIMEAISCGIPILATDVGGCNEIVNEQTGILIPKEFSQKEVLKILKDFKISQRNTDKFRKGVRNFWKTNYDITDNYKRYYQELVQLRRIKN